MIKLDIIFVLNNYEKVFIVSVGKYSYDGFNEKNFSYHNFKCFIGSSQADDIRDFEIEGISLGDSLLDKMIKKKLKNI